MTDAPIVKARYSPAETQQIRQETVSGIVEAQARLLERAPEKTSLNDLAAVQRVANECMIECSRLGLIPNFELLAAALGYCRRGLYDYLERHPHTETSEYIDRLRTAWASMRQMAVDRGAADVTMSIFVLLNSGQGFTNQHQIRIEQPAAPLPSATESDAARARILASLPDDLDGD